ncbi:MAG TPA: hypothetical protein VJ738_01860 [Steroidobacteraceae bacterium]|nr:hypothetical protein [Steroidobacteraceae bacterium]
MKARSIGGVLDMRALATLHRPSTRDEMVVVVTELASRGMPETSIAAATGLAIEQIRRILGDHQEEATP